MLFHLVKSHVRWLHRHLVVSDDSGDDGQDGGSNWPLAERIDGQRPEPADGTHFVVAFGRASPSAGGQAQSSRHDAVLELRYGQFPDSLHTWKHRSVTRWSSWHLHGDQLWQIVHVFNKLNSFLKINSKYSYLFKCYAAAYCRNFKINSSQNTFLCCLFTMPRISAFHMHAFVLNAEIMVFWSTLQFEAKIFEEWLRVCAFSILWCGWLIWNKSKAETFNKILLYWIIFF